MQPNFQPRTLNILSDFESEMKKYLISQNKVESTIYFQPNSCWNCCVGKAKKYCKGCKVARYCHTECQNTARHTHRDSCGELKEWVVLREEVLREAPAEGLK